MVENHDFLTDKKKWYHRRWGKVLLFFIIIAIVVTIYFIYVFLTTFVEVYKTTNITKLPADKLPPYKVAELLEPDDPMLGNVTAPLVIIEFGDFNCPVCQRSYQNIRELASKYPDKVKIYWKNYPVVSLESVNLAIAAECAAEQNKFWPLHDKLFQMQGLVNEKNLPEIAKQVGLDVAKFNSCLQQANIKMRVQFDYDAAQKVEAAGTPTFIINGYKIEGYVPMEIWEKLISSISK